MSIFIPPVGPTAAVDGEVHRPAIYELKGDLNVGDLIRMGDGLTPRPIETVPRWCASMRSRSASS